MVATYGTGTYGTYLPTYRTYRYRTYLPTYLKDRYLPTYLPYHTQISKFKIKFKVG